MPSPDDTILDLSLAQKQTVAELRAIAKKKGISLAGITRKSDIIAAIAGGAKPKKKKTSKGTASSDIEKVVSLAKKINRDRTRLAKDLKKTPSSSQDVRKALGAFVETSKKAPVKKKSPKKSVKKIYLLPYLNDGHSEEKSITTGNAKKDALVKQRLLKDYTHVRDIFEELDTLGYHFDGKHIIIDIKDDRPKKEIESEVKEIIELGPDTWMEGNIIILDEDEVKGTRLKGLAGLLVKFVKIV